MKLQNLIFTLITGHVYGKCVPKIKVKDIWNYRPGVIFFTRLFFIQKDYDCE